MGTATASHTTDPVRSIFSNKVFKPPLVQFFVLNSLRKRVAVYPFSCHEFLIKIFSFEKTIFTFLADEKLKIIFIAVSAIFSIEYLLNKIIKSCNALCELVMQM